MAINADTFVTDLAKYLTNALSAIKVFKYEDKPAKYTGEYIAINSLPFVYGRVLNDINILNVNIHVPQTKTGARPASRLNQLFSAITQYLPLQSGTEDFEPLCINNHYYQIENISQPMKDNDDTYFINLKVKVIFSNI